MMRATIKMAMLAAAGLAGGCGAPTKSAGEVSHLFSGSAVTLQEKADTLCGELSSRDEAPTVKGMDIDLNQCADAGRAALDYRKIKAFHFVGLDGDGQSSEEDVIHKSARAQIWLNKSLLGLAQALAAQMKKNKEEGDNSGLVKLDDSKEGSEMENLAKSEVRILEEPEFDLDNLAFSMLINFKVSGIIEANHDIRVHGKLISNAFAITVQTTEDREFKDSLIKNFKSVILIVPHAADVYLDMFVDLNIHSAGLDSLFKKQIDAFLGTGLKGMIDSLMMVKS